MKGPKESGTAKMRLHSGEPSVRYGAWREYGFGGESPYSVNSRFRWKNPGQVGVEAVEWAGVIKGANKEQKTMGRGEGVKKVKGKGKWKSL